MGRIRQMIQVDGRPFWTMFDTGARNTYVVPAVAALLEKKGTFYFFATPIVFRPSGCAAKK